MYERLLSSGSVIVLIIAPFAYLVLVLLISFVMFYLDKKREGKLPLVVAIISSIIVTAIIGVAFPFFLIGLIGGELHSFGAGLILIYAIPIALVLASLVVTPLLYKMVKKASGKPLLLVAYVLVPLIASWGFVKLPNYALYPDYSLYGQVIDHRTGRPLPGIKVIVHNVYQGGLTPDTTSPIYYVTDSNGVFHIDGYAKSASVQICVGEDDDYEGGCFALNGHEDVWERKFNVMRIFNYCDFDKLREHPLSENWITSIQAAKYTKNNPLLVSACIYKRRR
jgi:hypothetical protein